MSMSVTTATPFADFSLSPAIRQVLADMHISDPTPIQTAAIPVMLEGRDVVGQARTGSGKTLAFALPIVARCDPALQSVQALVLVPTRELAIQVGEVIARFAATRRLRQTLLYGGRSDLPEQRALRGAQIVVGTPGRTLDHLRRENLSLARVRILILDEADEMLDRGFARDVERIIAFSPRERQTAMFSATMPEWVAGTAAKHLRNPITVAVDEGEAAPPEIEHLVYDIDPAAKLGALRTLLDQRNGGPIIVFGRTKHGVKKLAKQLGELGYPAAALQGNLSQNARERVIADFRAGTVPILLATNVAARGLDVHGVERVINYELPESAEWFTHRAGRTGRMGTRGEAITFLTREDAPKWRDIERALGRRLPRVVWPGSGYALDHAMPDRPMQMERRSQRPMPAPSRSAPSRSAPIRPAQPAPSAGEWPRRDAQRRYRRPGLSLRGPA